MPPSPDLSFTGLDEFVNKRVVENRKSDEELSEIVGKNDDAPIIEEWGNPQIDLQDKGVIDSGCSRHMTGNMSYLTVFEEIDEGYVAFGGNPKGGKIIGKGINLLLLLKVNAARHNLLLLLKVNAARHKLTTAVEKQFWSTVKSKTVNGEVQLQALIDGKKIIITESTMRRDFQLEYAEGIDCLPNSTIFEQLTLIRNMRRVGKGFSGRETSLFQTMVVQAQAEMGEGSTNPTDPHHTLAIIQPSTSQPQKKQIPRKPKRKDTEIPQSSGPTENVADEAVNEEMDDSLERAATSSTSLDAECQETIGDTIAQTRVLDLETTKTTQANEIASLKRRVKKLERRNKSTTHRLKRMYIGRIADIDANKDIYLVNIHTDEDMFSVNDLDGDEVIVDNVDVATTVSTANTIPVSATTTTTTTTATITDVEITLAQALAKLKSSKPKVVKVVIQEPEQGTSTTTPTTIISIPKPPQDKGKWIMIEDPVVEQVKPIKKLKQMRFDEELAFKLQAEEEEEERLAREKAQQTKEANKAWDDVQAKIEADYQLAQRLKAQEQEELTDEEKARWVNTFVDYRTKLVEESSKKAEAEIAQKSSSKRAGDELE
ncbi:hypothetical protein Tco_0002547 [Tanacetum coccineum]